MYTKWGGFETLPWQFQAKLGAVLLLTVVVGYVHRLERRSQKDAAAAAVRIATAGKVATACALIVVVLSVLTFD